MAAPAFPFSWKTCPAWFRAGVIELREPTRGGGNVSGWGHSGDIVYTRFRLVARSLEGGRRMVRKKPLRFDLKAFLERAGDGRTILESREKQTLFSQGDPADAVFYILKGKIKLTVLSRHGKEAVIAMLRPDDFFGEGCLAGQHFRMATATATTNGSVMRFEKKAIIRLLHDQPMFSELFISYVLSRKDRKSTRLNSSHTVISYAVFCLNKKTPPLPSR